MTIHHATIKRAASLGIVLTETAQGEANAHHTERNRAVIHADAKHAVFLAQLAAKLALEYPQVTIAASGAYVNGEEFWTIEDLDPELDMNSEDTLDAAFSDIVDAIPEGTEIEEEEAAPVVVVSERYKAEYAARGDATGCGDWLHQTLKRYTSQAKVSGDDGKVTTVNVFDEPGFTACLVANGIELKGKWAALPDSGQKGWQGRYRMNGRQKLELPVCRTGQLVLENGTTVTVPAEDLYNLRARHPALLEEIETAEEEARVAAQAE